MDSSCTYMAYEYPLNLFIALFGKKRLIEYDAKEFANALEQLLDTLPHRERQALSLRYVRQLSFGNIGAQMGLSGARAGQLVSKGLRMLRHPTRFKRLIAPEINPVFKALNDGGHHTTVPASLL